MWNSQRCRYLAILVAGDAAAAAAAEKTTAEDLPGGNAAEEKKIARCAPLRALAGTAGTGRDCSMRCAGAAAGRSFVDFLVAVVGRAAGFGQTPGAAGAGAASCAAILGIFQARASAELVIGNWTAAAFAGKTLSEWSLVSALAS